MKTLQTLKMSGKEVLPLIEGGKGISVSSGQSSGAWSKAGGIGTFVLGMGHTVEAIVATGVVCFSVSKGMK